MSQEKSCSQCGTSLSAGSPGRLCPKCLLKQGLAANTAGFTAEGPEASARWSPPRPEELAARFAELEILELIGRGGMGAVYKARQKNLDRLVALKILPPEIGRDPAFAERFAREAQALARLSHPHIVAIHDFGQRDGLFFFLMEYIDGLNLRQLLDSGTVAPKEALAIVPQICDALQFAHDQGIVHRDIKPENILLDRRGQVKIADFGLAKLMGRTGEAEAVTEKVMGTPQYMAPEQVEHPKEVDHRADIYSLGVVFYQMLTGELPLGRFEPPSRKVLIDVRLDEVVLRALEKEPGRRYQQASQIRTEVETIVESSAGYSPTAPATPSPTVPPVTPRFSRKAIIGALCLLIFPPFTTIFGAIALSQIRHSGGRLCGLGLALFDLLLFPLLALDGIIFWLSTILGRVLSHSVQGGSTNPDDIAALTTFVQIAAVLIIIFLDAAIIWLAWRAVKKPIASAISPELPPQAGDGPSALIASEASERRGRINATVYLAISFLLVAGVGGMLVFFVPHFEKMLHDLHQPLPVAAKALFVLLRWLSAYGLFLAPLVLALYTTLLVLTWVRNCWKRVRLAARVLAALALAVGLFSGLAINFIAHDLSPKSHNLPPAANVAAPTNTFVATDGFSVKLPCGVAVQLFGVSENPSLGKAWWRPDGSPSPLAPYSYISGSVTPQKTEAAREFAIRLANLPAEEIGYQWAFDPPESSAGGGPVIDNISGQALPELRAVAALVPANRDTITVKYGVAAGPWRTMGESSGRGSESSAGSQADLSFSEAIADKDGGVRIMVAHNVGNEDVRVVAVDKAGREIVSKNNMSGSAGKVYQLTVKFPGLRLSDVDKFLFQTRPYEWAEFRNVALRPVETKPAATEKTATPCIVAVPSNTFVATEGQPVKLPCGATVELAGVTDNPPQGGKWWRADGSPLAEVPERFVAIAEKLPKLQKPGKDFLILLKKRPYTQEQGDFDVLTRIEPNPLKGLTGLGLLGESYVWNGDWKPDGGTDYTTSGSVVFTESRLAVLCQSFPDPTGRTTIKVGVVGGPWDTVIRDQINGKVTDLVSSGGKEIGGKTPNVSFGFPSLAEFAPDVKFSTVFVTVAYDLVADYQVRVMAVLNDGQVVNGGTTNTSDGKVQQITGRFLKNHYTNLNKDAALAISDIKEFRLEARPFQWVEFRNVTLRPNEAKNTPPAPANIKSGQKP